MKTVFQYLKPYLPRMTVGLVIKFIGTMMDLLLPWILSYMIDDVVPLRNKALIFLWGGAMLICSVVALLGNIIANRMASRVAQRTTQKLRHALFEKIAYLSCQQVDAFSIPSLESRLTTDTYNIHQMIGMMQRLGIRAPILLLGGIIMTLTLEPYLALVLIAMLPLMAFTIYAISKKGIPLYTRLQQGIDMMVRTVRENISGIRVIKALSKTEYEKERFDGVNAEVVARETKSGITMALSNPLMNLLLNLGLVLVIVVGAFRVNAGLTQPGKIIAFLTYFTIILNALLSISRMFMMYSKGSASAARISEVLTAKEDMALREKNRKEQDFHVVFDHVFFSYRKKKDNLTDISFRLKKGETLGIIGGTGSGKSTIAALLMRLYDPDSGEILISGRPVSAIPQEELHTMFGVVFQHDFLMADTIAANISFGRNLSMQEIQTACRQAQAKEFIEELPEKYEHMLTAKGTNLSGGQKQRVLVARALAGKPQILILDDSSSALDYRTDALLRRAVNEEFQKTTTIIIAQRISSIRHADHILVLENGCEIGYGTHEELMRQCELYREISISQMGGDEFAC
ncbi:ABC transporter ATP-binding protein [Ructibacterium gallinarum]|uniref:ABC transporter ATP-binding protein n=1 Tax=Ructibacterium gallinarum TaxID=2779355 RepID=A0A9D5R812_9FIRM|nr:ABC transporter ATP-binding protein [Ructibacterium gallinarum]MBE5039475.1 ABC transporter ATP-binding protein [Ructibacterium gallinarum]